jgi:hypothetical protein
MVAIWSGMPLDPNVMMPLQIDLNIGLDRASP